MGQPFLWENNENQNENEKAPHPSSLIPQLTVDS